MSTDEFWTIVDQSRQTASDESAILTALTAELVRRGERTIAEFEREARGEVDRLNTLELRDVANQLWVISDETWGGFRAWCVSQGRSFVEALQRSPGRVLLPVASVRGGPFDPPNGDLFLYCADYARIARTQHAA